MKYKTDIWYSPKAIISCFHNRVSLLGESFKTAKNYKEIKEAYISAIFLLGWRRIHNSEFYLQLVDPREQSPDIRFIREINIQGSYNVIAAFSLEVVTFDMHTEEEISDFILRTKLNEKKQYVKGTGIVCYVEKETTLESFEEINEKLSKVNKPCSIYILHHASKVPYTFQITEVYPATSKKLAFDFDKELSIRYKRDQLRLFRSTGTGRLIGEKFMEPF